MSHFEEAEIVATFCRAYFKQKADLPIRSSEMGVLIFIAQHNQNVTPAMISEYFQIKRPSVSEILQILISKEYVEKIPSELDRRSYSLEVTQKGMYLVESTSNDYLNVIGRIKNELGLTEFEHFIRLLDQASSALIRK